MPQKAVDQDHEHLLTPPPLSSTEEETDDPWSSRDPWTYSLLKPSSRRSPPSSSLFPLNIEQLPTDMGAFKKDDADDGKSRWHRTVKKVCMNLL